MRRSPGVGRSDWIRAVPAVCHGAVLLWASVVDPPAGVLAPAGPLGLVGVDGWLHAAGYATLTLLLAYALRSTGRRWLAVAVSLAVGYGGVLEVLQALVPLRAFSVADLGANAVGAALAGLLLWGWRRRGRLR